ncbi:MAG: sigma-54-dependent Fis family transcriptional regulator [Inquilinus sp.]|nr:sigma-54-dependent Fis family transcriptional regulator [Inquilinus sp.]
MSSDSLNTVLLVEDTVALARTYRGFLRGEPYDIRHAETGAEALAALNEYTPQVVLLDLKLPDCDGLDILREISTRRLPTAVIVITAHGSLDTAVQAMRAGASDFLVKPFNKERLRVTLRNMLERNELARVVKTYKETIDRHGFAGFIGSSLAMQAVYRIVESAAASDATVFITGGSGTGKEVCAQAIHRSSPRGRGPFIAINCAAIPKDLMESEVFGHVKGAFTGALSDRPGAARLAHGGTLFLDEICEMDPLLQGKLLRFVQTGSFTAVGGSKVETVDVRFVCATNRDPLNEVREGRFREDLYYRLHVIPIVLPPLRERGDDVMEIARYLLGVYAAEEGKRFSRFAPEAEQIIRQYGWPGNVRQLQNVLRNIVVLYDDEAVTADMMPGTLMAVNQQTSAPSAPAGVAESPTPPYEEGEVKDMGRLAELIRPLEEVEWETIENAVSLCGGDVRKAAVFLGIGPATIYRKRSQRQQATELGSDG